MNQPTILIKQRIWNKPHNNEHKNHYSNHKPIKTSLFLRRGN